MSKVYLSLGSNLGNRKRNLGFAIDEIERRCGKIDSCSSFYSTAPWGFISDNEFVNMALALSTDLEPSDLLAVLKSIEKDAGRGQKTGCGYEDRPLDIDILFYDDRFVETEQLTIPHPRLHLRLFVLVPMAEIASRLVHPVLNATIEKLLQDCPDNSPIKPI